MKGRSLAKPSSTNVPHTEIITAETEEAYNLLHLGAQQVNANQLQIALQSFQQALILLRVAGDRYGEGVALSNIGTVYARLEQYPQALELLQQALIIRRELDDRHGEAVTLNSLGGVYRQLEQYPQALELLQQALVIRREVGDRVGEGVTLGNLGEVYDTLGQYFQALEFYQQALAIRREVGNRVEEGRFLIFLGKVHFAVGQYRQALEQYEQAFILYQEIDDQDGKATSLNGIGEAYNNLGQYPQALEYFQQALTIFRAISDRLGEAATLNNMGTVYNYLGQYPQELELYQQALAIFQETGNRSGEAAIFSNIGETYAYLGEYSQALESYQQALLISRTINDRFGEASVLNGLGSIYRQQEQYSQALEHYQQALAIVREIGNRSLEGTMLGNIGLIYFEQKQYSQALDYHQQSLTISRDMGDRVGENTTLGNISILHWAEGNPALALEVLQQDATLREADLTLILTIGSDAQKQDYMATLTGDTYTTLSFHLQAAPDSSEAAKLALTTVLQRKGRVLDAVVDNLQTLRQNLTPADQQLLDQLQERRSQLAKLLYGGLGNLSPEQYRTQITELQTQAEQLENQLAQRSAEFRIESQPVTLEAVQQLIPNDAALVEIVLYRPFDPENASSERWGNPRYGAYVLHQTGDPQAIDLGEADVIDAQVEAFRQVLQSDSRSVQQAARQLDQSVMQPVRSLLGDKTHILISPDSQLNLIPFAALVNENDRYLLEDYTFTYLTSGRDLLKLQNDAPNSTNPVLFANPDYAQPGNAEVSQAAVGRSPTRGTAARSADIATFVFEPLEGTQTEVEAIAPLLPNATVLTGTEATEAALKQLQAPSILHLATHGFFLQDVEFAPPADVRGTGTIIAVPTGEPSVQLSRPRSNENPLLRSGLALAGFNSRQGGNGEDGVLTALEVTGLNLQGTRLVVMSACETGVGDVANGEGVYGLRRAFVMAGAESQMMSLWKVDDYGTSELMSLYYERLSRGENRSEALRQVQLEFLEAPAYRHPFYWAAFIFSGDWSSMAAL